MNESAPTYRYDVFISYSHSADPKTARALQLGMQRIARPWYRRELLRVFRDETNLAAAPDGWSTIEEALASSRYFLMMASVDAAKSPWVERELKCWLESHDASTVLIALTDGPIVWDPGSSDFDWNHTDALPRAAFGAFANEPFWVDLTWSDEATRLSLRDPRFLSAVAKLAAPIRNLNVAALLNEDNRQHRRRMRTVVIASVALVALAGVALWQYQSSLAATEREHSAALREQDQRVLTHVAKAYQTLYINPLRALDEAHRAIQIKSTAEGQAALRTALEVAAARRLTRIDERTVLGKGDAYLMERWREGDVFTRLRDDNRYALVATERGKSGANPPGTVYLVEMDTLRTVSLEPGAKASGRRLEYIGFSNDGERVFVTRQFYLDIYNLEGERINSVQLEFHAKPTHLIAGMFGQYVLVADTVGHLMLADTQSSERPQLEGSRYRDAALSIHAAPSGDRAAVIYESGKADLVLLDDRTQPRQLDSADKDVVHIDFDPTNPERLLSSDRIGNVTLWSSAEARMTRIATFNQGVASIDLATFTGDGKRIVALNADGTFVILDLAGVELARFDHGVAIREAIP